MVTSSSPLSLHSIGEVLLRVWCAALFATMRLRLSKSVIFTMRTLAGCGLVAVDPAGQRLRFVEYADAEHGFMCEARSAFNPRASAQGWRLLLGGDPVV